MIALFSTAQDTREINIIVVNECPSDQWLIHLHLFLLDMSIVPDMSSTPASVSTSASSSSASSRSTSAYSTPIINTWHLRWWFIINCLRCVIEPTSTCSCWCCSFFRRSGSSLYLRWIPGEWGSISWGNWWAESNLYGTNPIKMIRITGLKLAWVL